MAGTILGLVVVLAIFALFVWLARRAWRARRAFIKWPGVILSSLFALVFLLVAGLTIVGIYRLNRAPYTYQVSNVKVAMTPDQIQHGEKLAHICIGCHSPDGSLPLSGSKDNLMAGSPMGVIYAANLTPGGPLKSWEDGAVIRAMREGVDKDGRPLLIMPSVTIRYASDEDVQALVAYLRSSPAVNRDLPKAQLSLLGTVLVGAGMFPTSAQPPITQPVVAPPAGTADHGKYLVDAYGCHDCHGLNLAGGTDPNTPPGPNLTVPVPHWSQDEFLQIFKQGVDPTGRKISDAMPWKDYQGAFADQDIIDIYQYIHSLPPLPTNGK